MKRRSLVAAAALASLAVPRAFGQGAYPGQPIKLIVPFPPAGGTDIVARLMSDKLRASAGWTFVVDNRPGAGGNIGLDAVAKSKPDGLTLGMGQTSNLAINPTGTDASGARDTPKPGRPAWRWRAANSVRNVPSA